ncbi:MAG: UDP-N-acetylmuramoyl-L-alanine--D-glutamate ligase [Pseudomonadota bacterium]
MIPVTTRKDQRIALFGLGGSGMVTAQALLQGGADVIAFDDNPKSVEKATQEGIPVGDLRKLDFSETDALVLAPGVPLTHPKPHWSVELANANRVPIVGDVGLFGDELRESGKNCPFIAITGTNGKSTTTALISHILANAGRDVQMGGNIGRAVLSLDQFQDGRHYVVECSSYQIDLAQSLRPAIGVLLNLAPDHLDRHGTMANYAGIKERLVAGSCHAVVGADDEYSATILERLENAGANVNAISRENRVKNGVFANHSDIFVSAENSDRNVAALADIPTLRGVHNAQNACAAYVACHLVGLSDEEIQKGFNTFPGLAHRMEIIGNVGTTLFVNDSKGTNADAAAMALSSFENIYWIAGGLAKDGGIEELRPYFSRITKAFLIGEAAPEFSATLGSEVPYEISGSLDVAVASAAREAEGDGGEEAVVLLSPACASFDQYKNFELRGEAFRSEVNKLERFVPYGEKH